MASPTGLTPGQGPLAELCFPWVSVGGRRSQLDVLVPGSFMPPHRCPWARACLVLRFRVSIQGNEGKSYPWRLLCRCVEIKLESLVFLSPIPSPLYFSLLSLNTIFNYIFICGINYSVSALWVQGECLPHAPEDPGPSTVLVYVEGTQ